MPLVPESRVAPRVDAAALADLASFTTCTVDLSRCRIAADGRGGRGVYAARDLQRNDELARVPFDSILGAEEAAEALNARDFAGPPQCLLAAALAAAREGLGVRRVELERARLTICENRRDSRIAMPLVSWKASTIASRGVTSRHARLGTGQPSSRKTPFPREERCLPRPRATRSPRAGRRKPRTIVS